MERRYGGSCAIRLGPPIPNPGTNGPGREEPACRNRHASDDTRVTWAEGNSPWRIREKKKRCPLTARCVSSTRL